jgi:hypothetical protein
MNWQYFLLTLFLTNRHNLFPINKNQVKLTCDKIPITYSQDISTNQNHTNEITELLTKKQNTSFFHEPGSDHRYNKTDSDSDIIFNITKFHKQMSILKTLENKNVSQKKKLDLIEYYEKEEEPSPMKLNILAGGLTKDWNYDIYDKLK